MTGIDTDDLYGLPLARFVPERDALARALRADGRREEAAAVARLPKPSVAAWVVNQLVRGNRDELKSLLDAGEALRAAQTAVIEGRGDGHGLRAAAERERAAADELLAASRGLAGAGGPALSDTIIDRVAETLHAAAFDEEARDLIADGRLERELRHVGLGALAAGPLTPARHPPGARKAGEAPGARTAGEAPRARKAGEAPGARKAGEAPGARKAGEAPGARKASEAPGARKAGEAPGARKARKAREASEAREAAKRAEDEAKARRAAAQAEAQARRRVDRATRDLTRAVKRQEQAAQALREADEALAAARTESELAAEAHRQARRH